jgi:O-methyltransferase domain
MLGRIARNRDLAEAETMFARQLDVAAGHGLRLWATRATHELGTLDLMRANKTDRLARARELAAEGGDLATAATIDLQLGGSGWLALDAGACLAAALRCQPTAQRFHLDLLLAKALLLEAAAHAFAGRRAAMELAIAQAERIGRPEADLEAAAWARRGMGALLREDRDRAVAAYDTAVSTLREAATVYVRPYWLHWALLHTVQDDGGDQARAEARRVSQADRPLTQIILGYADAVAAGRRGRADQAEILFADARSAGQAPGWAAQRHLAERQAAECAVADGWGPAGAVADRGGRVFPPRRACPRRTGLPVAAAEGGRATAPARARTPRDAASPGRAGHHRPRGRGAHAGNRGPDQQADRGAAVLVGAHGGQARRTAAGQDRGIPPRRAAHVPYVATRRTNTYWLPYPGRAAGPRLAVTGSTSSGGHHEHRHQGPGPGLDRCLQPARPRRVRQPGGETMNSHARTAQPSAGQTPFDTLTEALGGLLVGHCLASVTNFKVADALGDTPQTAAELAADTGADPEALPRMLRLLAAHGVFACSEDRFAHTPASQLLRADHPYSMRDFVAIFGTSTVAELLGYFDYTLQTGTPAPYKVNPDGIFALLQAQPEYGRLFHAAMTSKARLQIASITAAYDFSARQAIADIGGGAGHLLQAVLDAAPQAAGVLFDLPAVTEHAAAAAPDRLRLQAGDFFKDPLPACDTYMMMDVIHDWDDDRAAALLSAVRKAALPQARLLVIETILADVPGPDWSKIMDVIMLLFTGGRQRSRSEHERLLNTAGFRLERVIPTMSDMSILEAVPA